jgi:hypothetical protein
MIGEPQQQWTGVLFLYIKKKEIDQVILLDKEVIEGIRLVDSIYINVFIIMWEKVEEVTGGVSSMLL